MQKVEDIKVQEDVIEIEKDVIEENVEEEIKEVDIE